MKMFSSILHFLILTSLTLFVSCGSDKLSKNTTASNQSTLTAQCSCSSAYSPVCGLTPQGLEITYDNTCLAQCHGSTTIVQGNCICSESLVVCGEDGRDYTECYARDIARVKIVKFSPCRSSSL